jgi:hypothetical protein
LDFGVWCFSSDVSQPTTRHLTTLLRVPRSALRVSIPALTSSRAKNDSQNLLKKVPVLKKILKMFPGKIPGPKSLSNSPPESSGVQKQNQISRKLFPVLILNLNEYWNFFRYSF